MSNDPASFCIHTTAPGFYEETRVGYSLVSIVRAVASPTIRTQIYTLGKAKHVHDDSVHPLLPRPFYKYTHKLVGEPCAAIVARFGRRMKPRDIVYMWSENPPNVTRKLQAMGMVVIREMINCTLDRRRDELRRAYALLGLPDGSGITDAAIAFERDSLLSADAVFCPNACVYESVMAYGVPAERCLRTSYGWSEARINKTTERRPKPPGTTFLFVGSADVRKGFPWVLEAWSHAGIDGQLWIAGHIEPWIRDKYAEILARPDVVDLGYVTDIGAVYRSADVFVFPSWEEGGPMVTIEAMGAGLPCIVTEMGGAGIVSAESGGVVMVPPGGTDAMVAAMRQLAADEPARLAMGRRAREIADQHTWELVGERRRQDFIRVRERASRTPR